MLTRRDILVRGLALGASAILQPVSEIVAEAAQPATPVDFDVPAGACDCHVHIFNPHRFPFAASRSYTPEPASVAELQRLHRGLRFERTIVVQPSVYGTDNSCLLESLKQLGSSARGIAVIDERTGEKNLEEMDDAGVRGVRINLGTAGQNDPEIARHRLRTAIAQIKDRNWHIQIYTKPDVIAAITDEIRATPIPIVLDHFAGAQSPPGVRQPGFQDILRLVQDGKVYVKISGAYRTGSQTPDYSDVAPLAKALIGANPMRILWGSDWPHPNTVPELRATDVSAPLSIDDGKLLNLLPIWAPDAALRKRILVENPTQIYFS